MIAITYSEWVWMGGSSDYGDVPANYGTMGVGDNTTYPPKTEQNHGKKHNLKVSTNVQCSLKGTRYTRLEDFTLVGKI